MTGRIIGLYSDTDVCGYNQTVAEMIVRLERRCGSCPAAGCWKSTQEMRSYCKSLKFGLCSVVGAKGLKRTGYRYLVICNKSQMIIVNHKFWPLVSFFWSQGIFWVFYITINIFNATLACVKNFIFIFIFNLFFNFYSKGETRGTMFVLFCLLVGLVVC